MSLLQTVWVRLNWAFSPRDLRCGQRLCIHTYTASLLITSCFFRRKSAGNPHHLITSAVIALPASLGRGLKLILRSSPTFRYQLPIIFLLPYWPLHTDALNSSAIGHSKREDSNLKSASSVRTRAELQNGWLAFLQIADACMLPRRVAPIFLLSAFRKTLPTDSPLGLLIHSRVVWSTHDATVAKWRSLSGPPPSFEPCRT